MPASGWLQRLVGCLAFSHKESATETTAATTVMTIAETASERAMFMKKLQTVFRLYKRSISRGLRNGRRLARCRVTIFRCGSRKCAIPKRIIENPTNIPAVQSSSHGSIQNTLMTSVLSI